MTKVKEILQSILKKVEAGEVTSEDIQTAQTILDSSVIISPRSELRKGSHHVRVKHRFLAYPLLKQPNSQSGGEFYTVQEVAKRFKVSDKAVYKWIDQKKIQYVRASESSRDIRIPKAQFRNPPSRVEADRREHEFFKGAVEIGLVRPKDLFRDEE